MQFDVREPGKRRFVDAVNRRDYPEVSFNESEFHPEVYNAILGTRYTCRSYDLPPEDHVRFIRSIGLDMCNIAVSWFLGREPFLDESGMTQYKMGAMGSRKDFEGIAPIDLSAVEQRIEGTLRAIDGTAIGWTIALPSSASVIVSAMGFQNYFIAMYDDPGFIDEFIGRLDEHTFRATELVLSYKPDMVRMGLFVADKNGPLMDAERLERFVYAPVGRHMKLLLESGTPVMVHSDGDNSTSMGRWVELGFSVFHPHEKCERFDIYESKNRWGRSIALHGNIDVWNVLTKGGPEAVACDTVEHLERLSVGGGYICGSSHEIADVVPVENLRAMAETIARFRK